MGVWCPLTCGTVRSVVPDWRRICDLACPGFGLPHGELVRDNLVREIELAAFILDREQGPSMPRCDVPAFDELANGRRQIEHPKQIRDGRAVLADGLSHLQLCQPELVDQTLVALGFLEGDQISALKILDERER